MGSSMSENDLLKELAVKVGMSDGEVRAKLQEVYDLLENRTFEERLKMGEDAIKAHVGR
jgi:hypothetical protein